MKTKRLIICAFFAAIICIVSPFSVMIGPVPLTFTLFALGLTAFVGGSKTAVTATAVYILAGIVGLPVFSGFRGGVSAIASPTGGFIFSYAFVVWILGLTIKAKSKGIKLLLCAVALMICYTFGIMWYILLTKTSLVTALGVCIMPFIPFDIMKLVGAYVVGGAIRRTLIKANLTETKS